MPPEDETQTQDPVPEQDPNTITIQTTTTNQPEPPRRTGRPPKTFTEEEVEKIRQEEKDKMYSRLGRVDDLESQLAELHKAEAERQKEAAKVQRDQERAAKKKEEEEMELRDLIAKKDGEWEAKLETERQERIKIMALLEQEQKHATLQQYMAQRMLEEGEGIMSKLHYTVGGNSPEEIDASIEKAKAASSSIATSVQSWMQNNKAGQRTAGVTAPPVGPPEMVPTTQTLTADDLKAMTPEDYAQNREALLREAGRAYRSR